MSRLLPTSAVTAYAVSALIIGSLFLQAVTPTVLYAMETESETSEEPTPTETPQPEGLIPLTEPEDTATDSEPNEVSELLEANTATEEMLDNPFPTTENIPAGTSTIKTGDAISGLSASTEVNTTEIDTASSTSTSTTPDTSSTTPPFSFLGTTASSSTEITNAATTTTHATSAAITGSNTTYGGSASINTGDAVAYADILNVVNTNIIDSDGLITFINDTLGYNNFDLRSDFELTFATFDTAATTDSCGAGVCDASKLFSSTNTADIENTVTVVADTGGNAAAGNTATVTTGNAYASANLINVANTNITDSQYLLLIFNNFDDYAGDIVLPNSSFFDQYFSVANTPVAHSIQTNNSATISNELDVLADSGDNAALGDNNTIQTGDTVAAGAVTNTINQTIIGGSTFNLLIRVHGDWSGTINGLLRVSPGARRIVV